MASLNPAGQPTPSATVSSVPPLVKPQGKNLDIAWQWNSLRDINNKKKVTCDFCLCETTGGITRAKEHQIGIAGNVHKCRKTPEDVRNQLKAAQAKKKAEQSAYMNEVHNLDEDEEIELAEIRAFETGKRRSIGNAISSEASACCEGGTQGSKKQKNVKGPIDVMFAKDPAIALKLSKHTQQTSIKDPYNKQLRDRTVQYIERFLCTNGIAFNVVQSKSFKLMVEAIGQYGPHLKVPSYHECRVPLLKRELEYTKGLLKGHEMERENYGCSIMSDGWTDKKGRTLINFLVNCPTGSMFVKSVDASSIVKTGEAIFKLLDDFVEEIGESKIVQVVTDNGANFKLAGKLLMAKRQHLFWTPCAAHCLDLILEDIGKISKVKRAIDKGIKLVGFIYNHSLTLNIMRRFTNKTELVRHGVTRFATTFLTLQRLHAQKNNLRKMFTSEEWLRSKNAKEAKGKRITDSVLMPSFWNDVVYSLKAMAPLVSVLRLVDNEKKPAMGFIYEAMDRAKETIQNLFKGDESKYREIFDIIDERWNCQLHHPLHAAGYYLNPQFYYNNPFIEKDAEVMKGLYECIERLSPTPEEEDKACAELSLYRSAQGLFGGKGAIRQRTTLPPAEWWKNYGSKTLSLTSIAVKVLSLTCSSSGCERNWSMFEHIHSKKRSRLLHQRLQDLVYIKYNQALKDRFDSRDVIDPIVLKNVDEEDTSDWFLGQMGGNEDGCEDELVFDDDNTLTWGLVEAVSGASEPRHRTRKQATKGKATDASSSKGKGKKIMVEDEDEEEELDDKDSDEEEEEIYKSDDSESDGEGMEELENEDDD